MTEQTARIVITIETIKLSLMSLEIPGDEEYSKNDWICDDHVVLRVTPEVIWPWLVQMGNGRAGWYSYDWLDNLGQKSFNHIDPSFQDIQVGQKISIFTVESFKENHYLTLKYSDSCNMTWFLEKQKNQTKLLTRLRVKGPRFLLSLTLGPGHLLMQKKQFKEIKKRVEKNTSW